ncbi:transmembrane protein 198-B [Gadus macrocephalus]|uniref:transmembrane protein 198-B n=1 Tax=Gadus macrocephalus TaxID=80720 RepID=UPI0028CB3F9B|nr:transmembrane protein 198-B [Gadus macrocephalus]
MTLTSQLLPFKLDPPGLLGEAEAGLRCEQEIERRYQIVPSVVCSMCCLFGVIYCFFGYRCFKAVMFLTGLMFGSVVIFMLCYKERVMDTQLSVEASVGIGLGIGTLCGLVTMLVRSVGLFMVGLLLGLLMGVVSLVVMEEFYHPQTVWVPLGVLLGSGTLFAVLTLQWQRCFVTLSTATFGAAVITVTVDYFIELFALVYYIYERLKVAPKRPVCWFTWVILGVWPVLALLGVLIQWKVTAEGYSHTELVLSRQQRRVQLMRIHQREERVKKEKESKKKKKKQGQKPSLKAGQKSQSLHHHHHHHHHSSSGGGGGSSSSGSHQQYHHPSASHPHHQTQGSHSTKAPPPQTEPGYHRKTNPVRRFDGDVLSPSYIRSFRDRQTDRRAYSHTRISRSRMAELDYDCGSQVPLTAPSGPPVCV